MLIMDQPTNGKTASSFLLCPRDMANITKQTKYIRLFLIIQSDLSVENGLFRLNEAQIEISDAVEKGLFRLDFL